MYLASRPAQPYPQLQRPLNESLVWWLVLITKFWLNPSSVNSGNGSCIYKSIVSPSYCMYKYICKRSLERVWRNAGQPRYKWRAILLHHLDLSWFVIERQLWIVQLYTNMVGMKAIRQAIGLHRLASCLYSDHPNYLTHLPFFFFAADLL